MRRTPLLAALLLLAGCFQVDPATEPQNLPGTDPGSSTVDIGPADSSPRRVPGDPTTAAFRTNCRIHHTSFEDPIVKPPSDGQRGGFVGHLHAFYGNTLAGRDSTPESIQTTGASTCDGGIANRTAYWAPAMLDITGDEPYAVVPHGPPGDDANLFALQIYYKSGYDGVLAEDIQNFPEQLRIIAGNSRATQPQTADNTVRWHCAPGPQSQIGEYNEGQVMPQCQPGHLVFMAIEFPQCWDGINLDSPDHKSHMAYGAGWPDKGCPPSHPVALSQITQNFRWRVPAAGMASWRLSSDIDLTKPAGMTAHADWMNGWLPDVFQTMLDNCYHIPSTEERDCQLNLLGDGTMLGNEPPPF